MDEIANQAFDEIALSAMANLTRTLIVVDSPLAFDTAVPEAAAKTQLSTSPVAGQEDILGAPDLETCTLLSKQLEYLAASQAAGVMLRAHVPIALIGGADNLFSA